MGVPLFVPWRQDHARNATITVQTGTADPLLVPDYAGNGTPSLGSRILSLQGAWGLAFDSAVSVAVLGLIHHSFDAGLAIRLEGGSNSDFSSPSFSAAITIPTRTVDGYGNAWLDVQTANGGSAPSLQYWRVVDDSDDNSVNLSVGEIVLGSTRNTLPGWVQLQGHTLGAEVEVSRLTTYAGVALRHPKGFRTDRVSGRFVVMTPAMHQALLDWYRLSDGDGLPSLLIPDSEESDSLYGLMSATHQRRQLVSGDPSTLAVFDVDFGFEELSRGLTWSEVA